MFLVMGEALVDVVSGGVAPPSTHVGGSPLNVAVGLARLGCPVTLVTRYGRDAAGELIHARLGENGVAELLEPDHRPTTFARGVLDPAGAADYEFESFEWDLAGFTGEVAARAIEDATAVHAGSLGAALAPGAAVVRRAVEQARPHASISFDPNVRPRLIADRAAARKDVEGFVALADVVRASESDLEWLYPDRRPERTASEWLESGPGLVVVTAGSGEIVGYTRAGVARVLAIEADVEDSVGAGDSSMAAILAALQERDLLGGGRREALRSIAVTQTREVLRFAARAAAVTVSREGPDLPTRGELDL